MYSLGATARQGYGNVEELCENRVYCLSTEETWEHSENMVESDYGLFLSNSQYIVFL